MVVGGNSLLSGFTDRLTKDLSQKTPPVSFESGGRSHDVHMIRVLSSIIVEYPCEVGSERQSH